MPNINVTLPNPIPDLPVALKGDRTKPIAATLAGDGQTPIALNATLSVPKPLDATLGGGQTPVALKVDAAVKLGGDGPLVANFGGSGTPIEIGLVNLDLKPVTVNFGKVRVTQENVFTFKLFGFIPLFSIRTGGSIDVEPQ